MTYIIIIKIFSVTIINSSKIMPKRSSSKELLVMEKALSYERISLGNIFFNRKNLPVIALFCYTLLMTKSITKLLHKDEPFSKKLYQLIIVRIDGDILQGEHIIEKLEALVKKGIGGFIVFNTKLTVLKEVLSHLQNISDTPLFVASDIERGVGQQVIGANHFPGQMAICAAIDRHNADDLKLLNQALDAIIAEAIYTGINFPLIPVMDVNLHAKNPIICTRAFSDNPQVVSWFGCKYIERIEKAGLISTAKHFPGHGNTATDSHIELPVIEKSLKKLLEIELIPFQGAIKQKVSTVMAGHLSVPRIDAMPASISEKMINDILQKELAFEGLVITDALNMDALNNIDSLAVRCLNSGVDIILHPNDADQVVHELQEGLHTGIIEKSRIDEAVNKVIEVKRKKLFNIKVSEGFSFDKNLQLSNNLSKKSITLVKGSQKPFKIHKDSATLLLVGESLFYETSIIKKCFKHILTIDTLELKYMAKSLEAQQLVVTIFTSVSAWKGSSGISEQYINKISALIDMFSETVVISLGSPYVLARFKYASTLIAAYEPSAGAQKAIVDWLNGEFVPTGRLPIEI